MMNNNKMLALACMHKYAVALPTVYQAALGLGVGGLVGGGSYLLSGLADKNKKHRLMRALTSALLGVGAGAGATYAGNYWTSELWKDAIRQSNGLASRIPPSVVRITGVWPPRLAARLGEGFPLERDPLFGLGPSHESTVSEALKDLNKSK